MHLYLGIDFGTTGVRTSVINEKKEELIKIFDQSKIDKDKDIAFTCGSGVTACILGLANSIISGKKPTIYDGSWSEYGLEQE